VAVGDVGAHAWNSCGGGLPWGQSLDQRIDNARSITYDWHHPVAQEMVGTADVRLRVRSSATAGHVSVKLCDVAPDGTSTLITRGYLDLEHRGCWPQDAWGEVGAAPRPLVPGEWVDVRVEFEATTWTLVPGHRLRLAVAGTDWPNCWPAREQFTLGVDRESIVLRLPVVEGLEPLQHTFGPGPGPSSEDADGVEWRYEHDVLARETRAHSLYGGPYRGFRDIAIDDHYEGHVGISTVDCSRGWVRGRSRLQLSFPEAVCTTEATLEVTSDSEAFDVSIHLTVEHDGVQIAERHWHERFGRVPAP
jgi:hypothetical protein